MVKTIEPPVQIPLSVVPAVNKQQLLPPPVPPVAAVPPAAVVESHHPAAVLPEGLTVTRVKTAVQAADDKKVETCATCSLTFPTAFALSAHQDKVHPPPPPTELQPPPIPISGTTITKISVPVNEPPQVSADPGKDLATTPAPVQMSR